MIEIKELLIKTSIRPRKNHSSINETNQIDHQRIKKEILEESIEHFSKVLKNKKER